MSTTTTYLDLTKPSGSDPVDISVLNSNFQKIDDAFHGLIDIIYPIGSIYINAVDDSNPSALFGFGTWERIGVGKTIIDAGTGYAAGSTGGEAAHTLTAAESGVPSHTHTVTSSGAATNAITGGSHAHGLKANWALAGWQGTSPASYVTIARTSKFGNNNAWHADKFYYKTDDNIDIISSDTHTHNLPNHTHTIDNAIAANASQAHNNMPPYLAVYIWKRIA